MEIQRETLRELQYLQEDIAAYFTDEHVVSGETYWTCVESVAIPNSQSYVVNHFIMKS